jgi:hypothetical protein
MQTPTPKDPAAVEAEVKATRQLFATLKEFAAYEPAAGRAPTLTLQPIDAARIVTYAEGLEVLAGKPRQPWTPPLEMLQLAETICATATPGELVTAEHLYRAYPGPTGGRSGMTGAELPPFGACTPLVRSCWITTARAALALNGTPPELPTVESMLEAGHVIRAPSGELAATTPAGIAYLERLTPAQRGTPSAVRPLATDGVRFA